MKRLFNCLMFLICGPFTLFIETTVDIILAPCIMYKKKLILRNKIHLKKDINPTILEFLRLTLIELLTKR